MRCVITARTLLEWAFGNLRTLISTEEVRPGCRSRWVDHQITVWPRVLVVTDEGDLPVAEDCIPDIRAPLIRDQVVEAGGR